MHLFLALLLQTQSLTLPANTAYLDPHPDGADVAEGGVIAGWSSPKTEIEWGGYFAKAGPVHVTLAVNLDSGAHSSYELRSGSETRRAATDGSGQTSMVDFGTLDVKSPGWKTFWVHGLERSGASFGAVQSLQLEGPAVEGAKFNLKERRNSASVHLTYPAGNDTEWFYNEVTAKEDPLNTYYMACGFNRGYFGMQVNGPNERRVIFSIWDAGNEPIDRAKAAPENLVHLVNKGPSVYASGFGNEGTGGHSHLVYPWKTGETQKFLVHAVPDGDHTTYTAYFKPSLMQTWQLIASFSAPRDGKYMSGLYSFVEDFDGSNGNLKRKALYGPAWIWSKARGWEPLTTAKFSHDVTGGKDRFDYDFGIEHGHYFLQNGGFEGSTPQPGAMVHLDPAPKNPPEIDFNALENLVKGD